MNSNSESTDKDKIQSTGVKPEQARKTGGKSPGAGLSSTLGDTTEQRVGDAGHITQTSPESTTENKKTTEAAFSSGTNPRNVGQTQSPAENETTDYGQTDTTRS